MYLILRSSFKRSFRPKCRLCVNIGLPSYTKLILRMIKSGQLCWICYQCFVIGWLQWGSWVWSTMCVGVYLSWNDGWCVDSTWKKISHVQVVVIKGSNETFRVEKVFNPCLVLSCDSVEESDQRVFLTTLFANAMALPVLT